MLGNSRARFLPAFYITRPDLPEATVQQSHLGLKLQLYCLSLQHPKDLVRKPLGHNLDPCKNPESALASRKFLAQTRKALEFQSPRIPFCEKLQSDTDSKKRPQE